MGIFSSFTPHPSSPSRGEVSLRVCGTMGGHAQAWHLPLEGGGWEGVTPRPNVMTDLGGLPHD